MTTSVVFVCITCEAQVATANEAREHEQRDHDGLAASYCVMEASRAHWYDDAAEEL